MESYVQVYPIQHFPLLLRALTSAHGALSSSLEAKTLAAEAQNNANRVIILNQIQVINDRVSTMTKRPYPRHQRRHDAVLLYAIENPTHKQKDIAKATGYSELHISRIMCSTDFFEMYEALVDDAAFKARANWLARINASS